MNEWKLPSMMNNYPIFEKKRKQNQFAGFDGKHFLTFQVFGN